MTKDKIWHLFARKLSGEASEAELKELESLEKESPRLFRVMQDTAHYWYIEQPTDIDYAEATYHLHYERMKKMGVEPTLREKLHADEGILVNPVKLRIDKRIKLIVASVLLLTILVITLTFINKKKELPVTAVVPTEQAPQEMVTKNGSNTRFTLPDGSHVWLNAGSKLNYSKVKSSTGNREVDLIGEAFFDVVRDINRPFIIHTTTMDVKVLGTSLNVKAYPNERTMETSLIHGKVEVSLKSRPLKKYVLEPDHKLVVINEAYERDKQTAFNLKPANTELVTTKKLSYIKGDTTAMETLWTKNKLSFDKESFFDISKKMERWYDVEFEFHNDKIRDVLLTGSFEGESLELAMEALIFSNNANFKYQVVGRKVTIY